MLFTLNMKTLNVVQTQPFHSRYQYVIIGRNSLLMNLLKITQESIKDY